MKRHWARPPDCRVAPPPICAISRRLTAATSTVMHAIESDLLAAVPLPARASRSIRRASAEQARLLANDIVALIENVKSVQTSKARDGMPSRDDLQELFALVQSFQETLSAQPSTKEIEASLHAVRRRLWRAEARIARLGWPTDLERKWRGVRERLNADLRRARACLA